MTRDPETTVVLHVDDDPACTQLVAEYLPREDERLAIETATSTGGGLDALSERDVDCVVADYAMPGRDGIAFLEAVRAEQPELPFILYTGKGSEAIASEAISAGVTDYLQKGEGTSQYSVLSNRIQDAVSQYRDRQAIREREENLSLLANRVDDILFMFTGDWSELLFVNSAFEEIWGMPAERLEAEPRAFLEQIHPEDREDAEDSMERIAGGEPHEIEYRVCRPDGEQRRIRGNTQPIVDESGEVVRIVGDVRDITEQKRHEAELERVNEELEVLNRVVRHDIRNDMTITLGWARMLEDQLDEVGREQLARILRSGEHIVELTEVARDYVETLTSEEAIDVEPIRLGPMLENEIALRAEAYPAAEIVLDGEIPDAEVCANEMLSSVFRNLLNNAVQHNDKDTPVVEVSVRERPDAVELTVADNGPGIDESHRESIFGKGEMGLESGGTGIGLYLVRTLVDQYDGDIQVADNEPTGTRFTVTLPTVAD